MLRKAFWDFLVYSFKTDLHLFSLATQSTKKKELWPFLNIMQDGLVYDEDLATN